MTRARSRRSSHVQTVASRSALPSLILTGDLAAAEPATMRKLVITQDSFELDVTTNPDPDAGAPSAPVPDIYAMEGPTFSSSLWTWLDCEPAPSDAFSISAFESLTRALNSLVLRSKSFSNRS